MSSSESDVSDDGWEDMEEDEDNEMSFSMPCQSLFSPEVFPSSEQCLNHMLQVHQFNFAQVVRKLELDSYLYIKFVNYARRMNPTPESLMQLNIEDFSSDEFLVPVNPEDGLLMLDVEELLEMIKGEVSNDDASSRALQLQLKKSEERASNAEQMLECAIADLNACKLEMKTLLLDQSTSSTKSKPDEENDNEGYFGSYSHHGIHEEMLKDAVRTEAYRDFILKNPSVFGGKIVLDVGCGSGVLSMFAAKAGAKKVIGVDYSEVAYQAMDIVRENKLDNIVKIVKDKAEDISFPNGMTHVDVIVSEWMGYFLLFESMLDTVIYCRDHYLAPGGTVYPDVCNMQLVALCDDELYNKKVGFWDDVYGLKMSAMKKSVLEEPLIDCVNDQGLISEPVVIKTLDLMSITVEDLDFDSRFDMKMTRGGFIHAIVGYFDTFFQRNSSSPVFFSTSPSSTPTHWKQAVFFLDTPQQVCLGDIVRGRIFCKKNKKDRRALDIAIFIFGKDESDIVLRQHYVIS